MCARTHTRTRTRAHTHTHAHTHTDTHTHTHTHTQTYNLVLLHRHPLTPATRRGEARPLSPVFACRYQMPRPSPLSVQEACLRFARGGTVCCACLQRRPLLGAPRLFGRHLFAAHVLICLPSSACAPHLRAPRYPSAPMRPLPCHAATRLHAKHRKIHNQETTRMLREPQHRIFRSPG